jgi:ketosteroid isomerase-like protein
MQIDERLLVEAMYASWAAGDLQAVVRCFSPRVQFAVSGRAQAASFLKQGLGRELLARRLQAFLAEFDVVRFEPMQIAGGRGWVQSRVRYHYLHRATGMDIDGTMRHDCRMPGGSIARFEVIHDAARMGAFLDLVRRMTAEA